MSGRRFLLLVVSLTAVSALGQELRESTRTEHAFQDLSPQARQWQLTEPQWRRYQELMSGVRGLWTPNADPLLVLGAHAKTAQERRHFADLYVAREFERVEGELAFQRAVTAAWARNYPQHNRINPIAQVHPRQDAIKALLEQGQVQRYGIVVDSNCSACDDVVRAFIAKATQGQHPPVDFFVRDTGGDGQVLTRWATARGVPVEATVQGRITLNHGHDYTGAVPQTFVLQGDGQWRSLD
ncbi:MAG: TIGR03759 family integrating conjugative element protein [Thalassospira sp.]|uniref:TIGR03759 family integrating conjugative element protein n=1 Tax=Thalassospira sp. TaxID=1912094 RepID=UPI003A835CE4